MAVPISQALRRIIESLKKRLMQKRWVEFIVRVAERMGQDEAGDMAASISYYGVLSIFPLLLGVVSTLGFVFSSEAVQTTLFSFFEKHLPTLVGVLEENISSIIKLRGTLGVLSILGLFWSGGAIFGAIGRIMNRAWGIDKLRPFYFRKLRDVSLAFGTSILFLIPVALTSVSALVPPENLPFQGVMMAVATGIVGFLCILGMFLLINKFMSNINLSWREIWPGALTGTILFEVIRNLFSLYLMQFANYTLVYGSIASLIVFLVWVYLSAFVFIIGIEFTAEYVKMKWGSYKSRKVLR